MRLRACSVPLASASHPEGRGLRLLVIRTDAIGDAVLAADQLQHLHERLPKAVVGLVCQEHLAGFYEAAPFPLTILTFELARFQRSWSYRLETIRKLRAFGATHAINTMSTRDRASDLLAVSSGASHRLGWGRDGKGGLRERMLDQGYSWQFAPASGHELNRNDTLLQLLGVGDASYAPRVWMRAGDEAWADDCLCRLGVKAGSFVLLYAGSQHIKQGYPGFGPALAEAFPRRDVPVLSVGAIKDVADSQIHLDVYGGPVHNLCGMTDLPRLAALMRRARMGLGADTGASHMACAVGVPQTVVMGGGHFGRFHPYSPLTNLVCTPLSCYGCGWRCRYSRVHCIQGISSQLLAMAVRETWVGSGQTARIFFPAPGAEEEADPHPVPVDELPIWMPVSWEECPVNGTCTEKADT